MQCVTLPHPSASEPQDLLLADDTIGTQLCSGGLHPGSICVTFFSLEPHQGAGAPRNSPHFPAVLSSGVDFNRLHTIRSNLAGP